jgi:hypothetical protein
MSYQFNKLREHVGHKIECVTYGFGAGEDHEIWNVSVECMDCGCVLTDADSEDDDEQG